MLKTITSRDNKVIKNIRAAERKKAGQKQVFISPREKGLSAKQSEMFLTLLKASWHPKVFLKKTKIL